MDDKQTGRVGGRIWAGLFLLVVGGVLLMDQLGFPLPDWLFNWQMLLIAIGIFSGLHHNFRGGGWVILILVGGYFLIEDHFTGIPLHRFLWPIVLIGVGLFIIARPRSYGRSKWFDGKSNWADIKSDIKCEHWRKQQHKWYGASSAQGVSSGEDYIDSTAIFSGVHRKVVSKDFKGGDVTSIMGGTELDFTQADINGRVILDVTQVMGGTKIIVPAHWEVRSEITAILGGYEDKRQQPAVTNPEKVLVLAGTSIMGGIELKNY